MPRGREVGTVQESASSRQETHGQGGSPRRDEPVRAVRSGPAGRTGHLVTGYTEARQALGDPRLSKDTAAFFANAPARRRLHPAVTRSMLASDPPRHSRLRKLVTGAFTTGAVAALRPFVEQVTAALLRRWHSPGPVDAVEELAMPLPVAVICELLGVPASDRADVRRWSADLFAAGRPEVIDAASHTLADYMAGLVAEKRIRSGDGLLDRLIAARDGADRLSEEELVSLGVLLLVAGHETTTHFIGSSLLALLQHPAELALLRRAPHRVRDVLDELLRHSSPVSTATFRFTTQPSTLGGTDLPPGCPVQVAIGTANRDPGRYPSPDRLDLARDASGHLAFGHGIHRCLGAPLARLEGEVALRMVLTRFPDIRPAVDPAELEWRPTRLVRGLAALPVLV
ncbi:cytochrome P450 family protein [Streptomyces sp. AA1529]|uniref:cytochrome P450 family protein n=1 Tax=Streptomyces sp. AA1529 TaxID=1203257 RepID=UPI0009987E3B|nr:cytochrome P450 [Streptomyces sp. AA1529]